MKKIICLMFVALIISFSLITTFAHGGRTDDNGGHYVRDTGEYHYHHGYPAHQHTNGECPYDYKDNITERSYSKKTKEIKQPTASKAFEVFEMFVYIVLSIIMILIIFFKIFW